MKWAIISLVLLGVLAAVCVAVLVASLPHLMGGDAQGEASGEGEEVSFVVATQDLAISTVVTAQSVAVISQSEAPPDSISLREQVIGGVLARPILEGQAFTPSSFVTEGSSLQLASVLEDQRAMQLSLPDYAGLRGLLYPSCRVDIVAAFDPRHDEGEPIATTLLQDILVLKVEGRSIFEGPDSPHEMLDSLGGPVRRMLVVVQVTSQQAQTLLLAQEHGTISLALRMPTDTAVADVEPTLLSEIVYSDTPTIATPATFPLPAAAEPAQLQPAPAEPAQPQPPDEAPVEPSTTALWQTTVIRGPNAEVVAFPIDGITEPDDEDAHPSGGGPSR